MKAIEEEHKDKEYSIEKLFNRCMKPYYYFEP